MSTDAGAVSPGSLHRQRFALIRPHLGRLAAGVCVLLLTVAIQLGYPKALEYFVDNSIAQVDAGWLAWAGLALLLALLVQAAGTALRSYLFSSTGAMIVADVRNRLFGAIVRQEIGFFDRENVGELTSRLSADVEQLRDTLTLDLAVALQSLLTCIGAAIMLLIISPALSLVIALLVPPVVIATRWIGIQVRAKSQLRHEKLALCGQRAQEVFSNIRLVHAFSQQESEQMKYAEATGAALDYMQVCNRLFAGFQGLMTFVQGLALLVTLWVGGKLLAAGSLSVGELTGFVLYAGMAAAAAGSLSGVWTDWMRSVGATQRVFELLDRRVPGQTEIETSVPVVRVADLRGDIQFDAVTFSYPTRPERWALADFTLRIAAGEKVALIGPSGAGKSTVMNLLLGFYTPQVGTIRFDGIDMRDLSVEDLRRNVAIVEQEPALFSGTILDNIRYGARDAESTEEQVIAAAKGANVHEFVTAFPQGYRTLVGNRGLQLSGGQKQRIAIARALLRNPSILLLDEPTSALDAENELKVQTALQHLMRGRTTIIVAHRFSTIAHADRVIAIADGRMVDSAAYLQLSRRHTLDASTAHRA